MGLGNNPPPTFRAAIFTLVLAFVVLLLGFWILPSMLGMAP